ncbi:MAG: TonB-dependent receptor [Gammaproteobacteria bacterium]
MNTPCSKLRHTGFLASLLMSWSPNGLTDPHTHPHHEPENVIVTADPLGAVDSHFAAPVTVLNKEALKKEAMRSIGETVANQPGVNSSDFGASVGRPVIRGQSGGRVRVLEDGVGTLDISTISGDHGVSVESIFAQQVEILRGPATLLYGSGASGGLVNVVNGRILNRMPDKFDGGLYVDYDTVSNGWLAAVQLDTGLTSNIALHFDGLARDTENIDIPGFAEISPEPGERSGVLENSDSDSENYSGGLSYVGANGFLGFNVSRLENNYGVPGAGHGHEEEEGEDEAVPEGAGTRIDLRQTRYDIKGAYNFNAGWFNQAKLRVAYNDYEHDEIEASGEIGTAFTNNEVEGRLELIHAPVGRFDGAMGIQVRDKDFAAIGEEAFVPPSEVSSVAMFFFEKADFDQIHMDFGLRLERQDAESSVTRLEAEHNLISISAGATYDYMNGYAIGFSASRSQRAPTIEELFAGGPHLATNTYEIGDANLGEETSYNFDFFWRKTAGRVNFDVTFFVNEIRDYVFLRSVDSNADGIADRVEDDFFETREVVDEDDALLLVEQSQSDATFWGFELQASTSLYEGSEGTVDLELWSDYVSGELDGGGNVPRLPPLRVGLNLDWLRGPLTSRFSVIHVTEQDDVARLETDTEAYTMVNVYAAYRIHDTENYALSIFARGSNLANEMARRHTSFVKDFAPLAGRSGTLGMRLEF